MLSALLSFFLYFGILTSRSISSAPLPAGTILVDTIGWTDRDRQFAGPAVRYLVNDTIYGIHAVWKHGYGEITYNFKPRGGTWRWQNGIVVNPYPRNLGCLDYNVRNGRAIVSCDYISRNTRIVSYFLDSAPGAGRFQEVNVATDVRRSLVAAARFGYPKFGAIRNDTLFYIGPFSSFQVGEIGPFPRHNLITAKNSSRLGFLWTNSKNGKLFFRETPDNGGTWYRTRPLSDSTPSPFKFSLFGAGGVYDSSRIHIVCDLYDGTDRGAVQLWHYCPSDTPPWHFITEHTIADTSRLGRHTAALARPSIGIDRRKSHSDLNILYAVWEQFDENNIDEHTGLYRADIWAAASPNNGRTWTRPIRLTSPDGTSKRFPFLAEVVNDTLHIIYFADLIAGSWELDEGEKTLNPVIYLRVPAVLFNSSTTSIPPTHSHSPARTIILTTEQLKNIIRTAPSTVKLFDATGRQRPLNPDILPDGVYLLITDSATTRHIQPLIKVRTTPGLH